MSSCLEQLFDECFPREWSIGAIEMLGKAWQGARSHCRSRIYGEDEGRDLLSHDCRARFETLLRRHSNSFDGITAESQYNKPRTYSHVVIKSRNLVLTASAVPTPRSKPRYADFRWTHNNNGQLDLFKTPEEIEAKQKEVYGLLLYGPPQARLPSFLVVAFPGQNWVKYVESFDLMKKYPGIISTPVSEEEEIAAPIVLPPHTAPEEKIQKDKKPRIRRQPKRVGEEES